MFFQIFCYRKYNLDKFVFIKEKLITYMYYLSNYVTYF